jgi:hypothetical protein
LFGPFIITVLRYLSQYAAAFRSGKATDRQRNTIHDRDGGAIVDLAQQFFPQFFLDFTQIGGLTNKIIIKEQQHLTKLSQVSALRTNSSHQEKYINCY